MDLLLENVYFNTLLNITRVLLTSSNSYSKFVKQLSCAVGSNMTASFPLSYHLEKNILNWIMKVIKTCNVFGFKRKDKLMKENTL